MNRHQQIILIGQIANAIIDSTKPFIFKAPDDVSFKSISSLSCIYAAVSLASVNSNLDSDQLNNIILEVAELIDLRIHQANSSNT